MDRESRMAEILSGLSETYGREVTSTLAKVFSQTLADCDIHAVEKAAWQWIGTEKWFPTPAGLRELIKGKAPSVEDKAIVAWEQVWTAVCKHGAYESVVVDAVAGEVIKSSFGGWVPLCRSTEEEQWLRKRFVDSYKAHHSPRLEAAPPAKIMGLIEGNNGEQFRQFSSEPVRIGEGPMPRAIEAGEKPDPEVLAEIGEEIRERKRRMDRMTDEEVVENFGGLLFGGKGNGRGA